MADYEVIRKFLVENCVTHEDMNKIWDTMKNHNTLVAQLSSCGKTWMDLNPMALKDLIKRYNAVK